MIHRNVLYREKKSSDNLNETVLIGYQCPLQKISTETREHVKINLEKLGNEKTFTIERWPKKKSVLYENIH